MRRVYLFYCLSGFVTLGYQVVWFRLFDDHFGATNLTFGLVLCGFLGGLGVGALLSKRVTDCIGRLFRTRDRLRIYGMIEILVSVTALLTLAAALVPADAWGTFPYVLEGEVYESTVGRQWSRVGIALACVFVPCMLMGATYPLLCDAFRMSDDHSDSDAVEHAARRSRFPAALYAWNTMGACAGVLATEFILLRTIGHDNAFGLMIALNIVIGLAFALLGGDPSTNEKQVNRKPPAEKTSESTPRSSSHGYLLTLAIVGGLLTGALEGDALKRVWFLGGTSDAAMAFVSFWSVLAIFLGACMVRSWKNMGWLPIKLACVVAAVVYLLTWQYGYEIRRWLSAGDIAAVRDALQEDARSGAYLVRFQSSLMQIFIFVGIFVFPAMFAFSLLLPMVCNRLHAAGKHVGYAYGLNTLAFCVGVIAFTMIAPAVNIFYSFKLFFAMAGIGVLLVVVLRERTRWNQWATLAAVVILGVACVLTPRGFDVDFVVPKSPPAHFRIHELRSNGSHTTYVVADPAGAKLYFDNHPMSSTARPAQSYMRLMAHFPLLTHEQPRNALLIGFGVGNTASAIAAHDSIERIDIVELNRNVIETADFFSLANRSVHRDHRVRFIHDDGRTFLKLTDQRYDLITSEPPPPMQAGVHRLYSQQYYEQACSHLTENGLMTQWLPAYQMPREAVDHVVKTFTDVFPHTLLFTGYGPEFILVGSVTPINLANIETRFEQSRSAVLDLQAIGIRRSISLQSRIVLTDAKLRGQFASGRVMTDQRNDLLLLFADPTKPTVIPYDPRVVLADMERMKLSASDQLKGVLMHLGRLRYHVPDFPRDTLATIPANANVTLADADWPKLDELRYAAAVAQHRGRAADVEANLNRSLKLVPQQPQVLIDLARLYFETQRFEAALDPLAKLQAIEPLDTTGYHAMTETLIALKRFDEARVQAEHCVRLQPHRADLHILHANILAELRQTAAAIAAYNRALELDTFSLEAKTRRDALLQAPKNP